MRVKRKFLLRLIVLALVVVLIPSIFLSMMLYYLNYNHSVITARKELLENNQFVESGFKDRLSSIEYASEFIKNVYTTRKKIPEELISAYSYMINSFSIQEESQLKENLNFIKEGGNLKIFYVKNLPYNKFLTLDIKRTYIFKELNNFLNEKKSGFFGTIFAVLYFKNTPLYWTEGAEDFINLEEPESSNKKYILKHLFMKKISPIYFFIPRNL